MYAKYLLRRVKYGRVKLWKDYKAWKNQPGMQIKDQGVYDIYPGSILWRHISPGSMKKDPEDCPWLYLEDYKQPYKYSRYFQRKLTPHDEESEIILSRQLTEEEEADFNNNPEQPYLNNMFTRETKHMTIDKGDIVQNIRDMIRAEYSSACLLSIHPEIRECNSYQVESNYNILVEASGSERAVDLHDGNPIWMQIYFENLQTLYDIDDKLREEHDYKMPMYVGRTKIWQAVNDIYGKDEVDKVQVAIGAPVQEQLDLWDEENNNKFQQAPFTNENQAKFRDVPEHWERLDHNYDNILYERARNQAWESMRNMRYWELEKTEHHH